MTRPSKPLEAASKSVLSHNVSAHQRDRFIPGRAASLPEGGRALAAGARPQEAFSFPPWGFFRSR